MTHTMETLVAAETLLSLETSDITSTVNFQDGLSSTQTDPSSIHNLPQYSIAVIMRFLDLQ